MASPLDALSFREIYGRTLMRPERGREHAHIVAPYHKGMTPHERLSLAETVRRSMYRCVDYGEVYYVSREMTEYLLGIVNAPRNKERKLWRLDQGALPSLVGFVYFDGPVPMPNTIYSKSGVQNLVAVLWDQFTHDNQPKPETGKPGMYFGDAAEREVVGKIIYSIVESPNPQARDLFGPWKPRHWIPATYGMRWEPSMVNWDLMQGDELPGIRDKLSPTDEQKDKVESEESMRILMRMIEAWCLVIQQEIPVRHPRPSAYDKVMHKEGRPPADVQVTHLRRYEQRPPTGLVEVDWAYRWKVKGHMRWQRVGPGRMFLQQVWVKEHVKGPADKPLIERPKVTSLDR